MQSVAIARNFFAALEEVADDDLRRVVLGLRALRDQLTMVDEALGELLACAAIGVAK